jgi:hypothetical protein
MRKITLSAFALALVALSATGVKAQAPANDLCSGAINLNTSFGQTVNQVVYAGPYDNTNATTQATDPITGYECFGEPTGSGTAPELNNTLWYTFVGDGGLYMIETSQCSPALPASSYIDDGDTQIAIYTGTCGNLTGVACNEDGPSATATSYPAGLNFQTTAGTTYYMLVDGFSFNGAVARGQFCINVKKLPLVTCNDPAVTPGTSSASDSLLCFGDTLTVTSTGVLAPTAGTGNGVSWIISSADISGSPDPLNEPSLVATYTVSNPAPATSNRILINNGSLIGSANVPYGTYYWTPIVFANATQTTPGTPFLSSFTLDTACVFVGNSVAVVVANSSNPACNAGSTFDVCSGATDITTSFGQAVNQVIYSGPYDNTTASTDASDPVNGFECFGEPTGSGTAPELNNTLWFSFVGDGGNYFIETSQCSPAVPNSSYIDDGDTQIAIYTGNCGSLTGVACNEDGPSATATTYPAGLNFQTTAGTTYYMLVDGFSFNGAVARGQFCINVKKLPAVACTDPTVTPGTASVSTPQLCFGDTLTATSTGVLAPSVGAGNGVSWIISSADISGSNDPLNEPSLVATYTVSSPAPATSIRTLVNNGALIGSPNVPYGTYYWTPVVFANATQTTPGTPFLSSFTLDPTCTFTGTSKAVNVLAQGANCTISAAEDLKGGFSISNVYPVPVQNTLNVQLVTAKGSSVTVSVKDLLGREVTARTFNAVAGENNLSLDLAKETAGVYFVTISNGKNSAVSKFVKE